MTGATPMLSREHFSKVIRFNSSQPQCQKDWPRVQGCEGRFKALPHPECPRVPSSWQEFLAPSRRLIGIKIYPL